MLSYSLFFLVHSYHILVQPFLTLDTIVRNAILLTGQDDVDIVKLVIQNRVVLKDMFESIVSWTNSKYIVLMRKLLLFRFYVGFGYGS